jgi:uncharacterized protein with PQ loop repeat
VDVTVWLGWMSSMVLLLTIVNQIHTQWKLGSSKGVSWFLFIGQIVASIGFVTYSVLIGDKVFIVTNGLLLLSHIVGLWVTLKQKSRAEKSRASPTVDVTVGKRPSVRGRNPRLQSADF